MPAYPKNFIEKQSDSAEPKQLMNLLEDKIEILADELNSGKQDKILASFNIQDSDNTVYSVTVSGTALVVTQI